VLGLLVTAPAHGFALAKELKADGRWGQIWTVPRPLVYRALIALEAGSLIIMDRAEESRLGPRRAVYQATPTGKAAFSRWLNKPVEHYRDVRSQLILKLGFLWMRGESAESLLAAQLAVVGPMLVGTWGEALQGRWFRPDARPLALRVGANPRPICRRG